MKIDETSQKLKKRRKRAKVVFDELNKLYPNAKIELNYSNTLELLIAVILSAQCTDKKVNEVTEKLFKKYPSLDDYIGADLEEFGQDIRQTGFYRNKAKNVLNTARIIKEEHDGKVPDTMEELIKLSGVARKTANIILSVAYKKNEGVAVDTHVRRLSNKFKLTDEHDPKKIEKDLMEILPEENWGQFSLALVLYGRRVSTARDKNSDEDVISQALIKASLL